MEQLGNVLLWTESHQFVTSAIIGMLFGTGSGGVITLLMNRRNQIKINKEAERIKYEMKRQYMYTEIKTRNLLEKYPELYSLMLQAPWFIPAIIMSVQEKIHERDLSDSEIREIIKLGFMAFLEDPNKQRVLLQKYADFLAENSIFFSPTVYELGVKMREFIGLIRKIIKTEIAVIGFDKYSKAECIALMQRLEEILEEMNQTKDLLMKQVNEELSPY